MRVFISHAREDKPLALELAKLPDFVDAWVDVRELLGGKSLQESGSQESKSTMRNAAAILTLTLLCLLACTPAPEWPPFSADFLHHVARNSPEGHADCYVAAVQRRWASQAEVQADANRVRISRGQTDDVNHVIRQLAPECTTNDPHPPLNPAPATSTEDKGKKASGARHKT